MLFSSACDFIRTTKVKAIVISNPWKPTLKFKKNENGQLYFTGENLAKYNKTKEYNDTVEHNIFIFESLSEITYIFYGVEMTI